MGAVNPVDRDFFRIYLEVRPMNITSFQECRKCLS